MRRHVRLHATALAIFPLLATAVLVSGCGGSSTAARLHSRLLSVADLPAGWSAAATGKNAVRLTNTDSVSIASAPVQTADTRLGTVAYRAIGTGPPLLLITGYGGTMEDWDPRFVDALAEHHRVITFDNAGVGKTPACRRR